MRRGWRENLYTVIFESETRGGRLFDLALIASIGLSVLAVTLESVEAVRVRYGEFLAAVEWFFTVLFTVEYVLRLLCVRRIGAYLVSPLGLIDLFAVLPSYVSLIFPGLHYLVVVRILRVLRVFRVLKLVHYLGEANYLLQALVASRRKITLFVVTVMTLVVILGSVMYLVEGAEGGFTSIPKAVYWAVVTLTTVGYGDMSPQTSLGQGIATVVMILGYGIIAVPTGIVTVELSRAGAASGAKLANRTCPDCHREGHLAEASFCFGCGGRLV